MLQHFKYKTANGTYYLCEVIVFAKFTRFGQLEILIVQIFVPLRLAYQERLAEKNSQI